MDRTERFYKIELMIRSKSSVRFDELQSELEVSRATLMRDLQYLRDRMDAPIVFDRDQGAYRFALSAKPDTHELPGMWFSDQEIYALLSMHQLVNGLDPDGVLARHLQPLLAKLHGMLGSGDVRATEWTRRVRIVGAARRLVNSRCFELVVSALFKRRQLQLRYYTRTRRSENERLVSPQRLVHYRNTWYLDAWCHRSEGLRRFALDAMRTTEVVERKAKEVSLASVEAELDGSYGVFGGQAKQHAVLRFTPEAAQWVAMEQWHPEQQASVQADGSLMLRLPYSDATELVMDVLRHGPQVKVIAPATLAARVAEQLKQASAAYE
jgi:predicted DNA-binding transcriptional regulator YafY